MPLLTIVIVKFEVDRLKIGQEKLRVKLDICNRSEQIHSIFRSYRVFFF